MKFPTFIAALLCLHVSAAPTDDADRAALLRGVTAINTGGLPGGVCAYGPDAFAVIAGKDSGKALLPVVAAARWEKGRIVLFGHDGFLREENDKLNDTFLTNAARWVCGERPKPKIGIVNGSFLLDRLKAAGMDVVPLDPKDWPQKLAGLDAVFSASFWIRSTDIEPLAKFIRSGGGLVTGATGWGLMQMSRTDNHQFAAQFPGNLLMEKAGLALTGSVPARTLPNSYAAAGDMTFLNAGTALQAITDHTSGKTPLPPALLAQCAATLGDALRSIPPDDKILLPKIAALSSTPTPLPSVNHPIRSSDALARLAIIRDLEQLNSLTPDQKHAHPAADIFPGAVEKSAPRIADQDVAIDLSVPQWHSTGLYAAPGEVIRVSVPPQVANKGMAVRIGCHTDTLWHLDEWKRIPAISSREMLKEPLTLTATPFGGLIYIEVPDNAPPTTIRVTLSGAVEAPHFILGKTSVADWKSKLRDNPAPWAELETNKVILSVPSEKIRHLDNPDELMTLWDRILDAEADLSTIPHERKRPERIVPDIQISAGYMHSGYPIMTWLDHSVEKSLSTQELSNGSWGHFHELGHNHQQPDWTFDGTVEVTCNLYSLYVSETICHLPPGTGHDAMDPAQVAKRLKDYLAVPAAEKFKRWKNDPFIALIMYDQLRAGFGWDTYKKVFAEYRALPQSERPKNDDEKRDQWLVRFSKAAGKNLGPFFEAWGVPTSQAARDSIKDLPEWMPADWPRS